MCVPVPKSQLCRAVFRVLYATRQVPIAAPLLTLMSCPTRCAVHYMTKYGLPDESCQLYNATDHTKFGKGASLGLSLLRASGVWLSVCLHAVLLMLPESMLNVFLLRWFRAVQTSRSVPLSPSA